MTEGTKRRLSFLLRSVGVIVAGGMMFGAVAAYSFFPKTPLLGAAYGALSAALQGTAIFLVVVGSEVFLPRTRDSPSSMK